MNLLSLYRGFARFPLGRRIISLIIALKAPYFTTLRPYVAKLEAGSCTVRVRERWRLRNHLGTVHAIALCNICELTMGLAVETAMPRDLRWIAKGMTVSYLKKAKGILTGTSVIDPCWLVPGDVAVPVEVRDAKGVRVVEAAVTIYLTPRG